MKILRSKKALSPVVASIILIAVTVAVSIAVAAWMGALTFTFTSTEQVSFIDCLYASDLDTVDLTIKNTGSGAFTVSKILINGYLNTSTSPWSTITVSGGGATGKDDATLDPNEAVKFTVDASAYPAAAGIVNTDYFERGSNYAFTVVTSKNNQFGPYTKAASP